MAHRAVYKTTTAEFLDDFYQDVSQPGNTAFSDALALLDSTGSLSNTTQELEARYPDRLDDDAQRFQEHWLDESGKHGSQPVDRVLRHGYRKAIEIAQERGLRIENFWVTGAGPDFELHICEGSDRIVCFMFVPGEDDRPYGSQNAQRRSWVVREGDIGEVDRDAPRVQLDDGEPPIVLVQVSGPTDDPAT
jgi:hypothetical protein